MAATGKGLRGRTDNGFRRALRPGWTGRALCLLGALLGAGAGAADPTADALARLPLIGDAALSPSGDRVLMLRAIEGTYHLVVADLEARTSRLILAADTDRFTLSWCRWANETRIVCSIQADSRDQPLAGDRGFGFKLSRLLAVDADGGHAEMLIRQRPVPGTTLFPQFQDRVISWLTDRDDEVLIQLAQERLLEPSVYRLDVRRNTLKRVLRFRAGIRNWYADAAGRVRLGVGYVNDRPGAVLVDGKRVRRLALEPLPGGFAPNVYGISADGRYALLATLHGDASTLGLHRFDLGSGEFGETLLEDPTYDVIGALLRDADGVVRGVAWSRDEPVITWFDPDWRGRFERIRAALGGRALTIVSSSRDAQRAIIHSIASGAVPSWYLFDARAQTLTKLADDYRLPDGESLAAVESVHYPARDGTLIPAYLTRPAAAPRTTPLPAVVLPHGGPYARDVKRFDYWRQFLAAEGYVVLQPNFRGSAGFGIAWLEAGFAEWGGLMQQDVMDGLDWLVAQGIADPDRVCIVGGSYGGFVALTAAWQAPGRIRCAVSFAGVSDLADLMRNRRRFDLGDLFVARIARTAEEVARATAVSAVRHVEEMRVPLLIVHGDADRTVPVTQSRELVRRLEAAGRPFRYIEQAGGDHHLTLEAGRVEFLTAMRAFLAEHIGPGPKAGSQAPATRAVSARPAAQALTTRSRPARLP